MRLDVARLATVFVAIGLVVSILLSISSDVSIATCSVLCGCASLMCVGFGAIPPFVAAAGVCLVGPWFIAFLYSQSRTFEATGVARSLGGTLALVVRSRDLADFFS